MDRHRVLLLFVLAATGCGLITPSKTSQEDRELQEFAEARQRAATYYDGGEYVRSAAQYKKALDLRPHHYMTQLGYAYSLVSTRYAPNIVLALKFYEETMGRQFDDVKEVKRVYGMAEAYRLLAMFHRRRAREREDKGIIDEARADVAEANEYAKKGVAAYEEVIRIDERLMSRNIAGQYRASASLAPMARIGIAVCCIILGSRENQQPIERAVEEVNQYAEIAAKAREYWKIQRRKVMEVDPLDSMVEAGTEEMQSVEQRARYDERIKSTVEKEALVRQALVETYMFLDRFDEAIAECGRILELDPEQSQALFFRARCYTLLKPPQYERALKDMREYRSKQDLTRLTQEVIKINQLIKMYEAKLRDEQREKELERGEG